MTLFGAVLGLALAALLMSVFLRWEPARLARALRVAGPLAMLAAGLGLVFLGRPGIGVMLLPAGLAWWAAGRTRVANTKSPARKSTVRTAALEMELDHDSGGLEGLVLAGSHEGKALSALGLPELEGLLAEVRGDAESRQLLETYLDGRFPAWREGAQAHHGDGEGVAPGSGAMTKQEAYQVLGLETGAAAADIRKAHRRLMQRVHPDLGGSSFLAARINEAKDVLLSDHN